MTSELGTGRLSKGYMKATAVAGAVALLFLLIASRFWAFTVDDAYISARYAWNAAQGAGLVFNPGEHVMGYTNLLLVLLETVAYAFGGDGILTAKIVGVVAALAILGLTYLLARQVDSQHANQVGMVAVLLLILFPELALGAVIGLETALFVAWFLAALWIFVRWVWQEHGGRLAQAGLAFALLGATLTRPEGLGLAFFLAMAQLALPRQRRKVEVGAGSSFLLANLLEKKSMKAGVWARAQLWIFLYGLMLLPVLLWLNHYYGSPIPNTFVAKTVDGIAWENYRQGIAYIVNWVSSSGLYLLSAFLLWPFLQRQVSATLRLLAILSLYWFAYVVYTGGDWMPGYRFLLPVLPLIYLMAATGMMQVWQLVQGGLTHLSPLTQRLFAGIVLVIMVLPAVGAVRENIEATTLSRIGNQAAHYEIAQWLSEATTPNTTVALMDVGLIGFMTQRPILDTFGLVNREVAALMHSDGGWVSTSTPTAERIAEYTLAHQPEIVILSQNSGPDAPFASKWSHDSAIYHNPQFQAHYELLFVRQHHATYFLSVYARKELSLVALVALD